jgi:hypothetical protein
MEPMNEIQKSSFMRVSERVPFTKRLTVLDVNTGQKFEANGIDMSVAGMGFYSKKFFQKNSRVSIQVWLDNVSQKDPVGINAIVRWSKLEQDGAVMGVQFDTPIKSAEHPKLYELIYKKEV